MLQVPEFFEITKLRRFNNITEQLDGKSYIFLMCDYNEKKSKSEWCIACIWIQLLLLCRFVCVSVS